MEIYMRIAQNFFVLCLLLASLAFAQRQSVAVLPSLATPDTKLTPKQKELLMEEVRTIAAKLPQASFVLISTSMLLTPKSEFLPLSLKKIAY